MEEKLNYMNVQAHQLAESAAPIHGEAAESQRTLTPAAEGGLGEAPCSAFVSGREAEPSKFTMLARRIKVFLRFITTGTFCVTAMEDKMLNSYFKVGAVGRALRTGKRSPAVVMRVIRRKSILRFLLPQNIYRLVLKPVGVWPLASLLNTDDYPI
jgi:hypothetical protein